MTVPLNVRLRVPDHVLLSELDGESVLLNLGTESYFGLNAVGTRMLAAVTAAESVDGAFAELAAEFDAEPDDLRRDLLDLIESLMGQGLLETAP